MFQPNPPTPKAMPDDELNATIAKLQSQPDGLVAAMALIEEQSKLRQEDALELSKWQLQEQMRAATAAPEPEILEDPAAPDQKSVPVLNQAAPAAEETEPEIDIFAQVQQQPVAPELPDVTSQTPAQQPVENIDDIVASLNASYAVAATEEVSVSETDNFVQLEISETVSITTEVTQVTEVSGSSDVPSPIDSPVLVDEQSGESDYESVDLAESSVQDAPATARASALAWSWLAIATTPVTLLLASYFKDSGASLAQSFILMAASVFGVSLIAAVGAVASARGSSSLTVISRAGFGVWGNTLPAVLMFLVKLLWAAVLIYLAARIISPLIFNQPWFANLASALVIPAELTSLIIALAPTMVIASIVAGFGGVVMLRSQQITTILSVAGIASLVFFVASSYSVSDLASSSSISSPALVDLAISAVAIFGFTVFSFAGDFARKLPAETPGPKVFFLSFASTLFIPLAVGVLGLSWLFMAGDTLESSFTSETLATVAAVAPIWVFVIFAVTLGLSLLHLISHSLYSLSGSLRGILRIPAWVSQLLLVILVIATVVVPSYFVAVSVLQESIYELVLIAAVVAASWSGIVLADALIRTRGYHEVSLTREYGFYGKANPANLIGFAFAVVLGLGYLNGGPQLSSWTGYLGDFTPGIFEVAGSNIGIAMAFGAAILFPVMFGIGRIRKQEHNLAELDQRREELKEFLDAAQ